VIKFDGLSLNIKSGHIMINVQVRDSLIQTIQQQEQTIEKQREEIRVLKNKNRVKKYFALEAENLDLIKKLREANKVVERLLVVQQAYEAYKKAH
jgi:hypothetical protein